MQINVSMMQIIESELEFASELELAIIKIRITRIELASKLEIELASKLELELALKLELEC